ncbi:GAF domain-containing protein [Methylobacterium sp. E-045]|uniref:GAF domain-containing protein n=1 Tax=Methylobacterium sp. E-045 TaxID=2836575 RepID=UPI001FBBFBC6|nr:GAF domain-containing protein [Methylobacterium sp. E-045]MCJ2129744.1 GAF domain-containing protein [Methylobacterium sp. E-045]
MVSYQSNNEFLRLEALKRLNLIESSDKSELDRIVNVAQKHFSTSITAISLVDADTVWTKSACGPAATNTPRELSFCKNTIMHDTVYVVHDATKHSQFANNPFVKGAPYIRFYAGAPLIIAPQIRIGTLCIADSKPRGFEPSDVARLTGLAHLVVGEIWLKDINSSFVGIEQNIHNGFDFSHQNNLNAAQIRAARALLDWTISKLATEAHVSVNTIKRLEARNVKAKVRSTSVLEIRRAFEHAGIFFIGSDGVRLVKTIN